MLRMTLAGPINMAFLEERPFDLPNLTKIGKTDDDVLKVDFLNDYQNSVNQRSFHSSNANFIYKRGVRCSYGLKQISVIKVGMSNFFEEMDKYMNMLKQIYGDEVSVSIKHYSANGVIHPERKKRKENI